MSRARVFVTTTDTTGKPGRKVPLDTFIRNSILQLEDCDPALQVLRMAEMLGRLIEITVLKGADLRNPINLNALVFGSNVGPICSVSLLVPGDCDDDIPF